MKTAMQELIDWVRKTLPMDLDWPRMIEDKAEKLHEKEKNQIVSAYDNAKNYPSNDCNGNKYYFMKHITND